MDFFGTEAGSNESAFVKRTIIGGMMKHHAELVELVLLNLGDRPRFTFERELLEFGIMHAQSPTSRQAPIPRPERPSQPLRQSLIGGKQRIKSVFQVHDYNNRITSELDRRLDG